MPDQKMTEMERKFAEMIWAEEPVHSGELVRICLEQLQWKKSTTYTMLKRLIEKGIVENNSGTVVSRISREAYDSIQSRQFLKESFGGSLPKFLAAFTRQQKLSKQEIQDLQKLIDEHREG